MEIAGIEVGLPPAHVSNADILELVTASSNGIDDRIRTEIEEFLSVSGSKWRLWRRSNKDPSQSLSNATSSLLQRIDRDKIKIVIWCGVAKYFAEPAHASIFCDKHKITPSVAFDVSDGCLGWVTALSIVQSIIDEIGNGYALIVSHEFPMGENGVVYPKSFTISSYDQLRYKMPALTLGEACTLTLLRPSTHGAVFRRAEIPKGAQLCSLPLRNFEDILTESKYIPNSEEFITHFKEMSSLAAAESISMMNDVITNPSTIVAHSYSRSFERFSRHIKKGIEIVNYFSEFGNVATSSIPLNLVTALRRGHIAPEKPVYAWCASAGMKVGLLQLHIGPDILL